MSEPFDPVRLLRDAPVDSRRLAAVRRRVLERLGARRPGPGRWILAGAAVCGLAAAAWVVSPPEEMQPPSMAWRPPAPPDWALTPAPRVEADRVSAPAVQPRIVRQPLEQRRIEVVAIQEAADPNDPGTALLEIPTSNPDVILYWLVDEGGD